MNVYVRKWGNSAAVRLPASALAAAGLRPDDEVTVRGEEGRIVIEPARAKAYDLQSLIDGITPENRHEETDWGPARGKEFW
jgi:antitoxin MazE